MRPIRFTIASLLVVVLFVAVGFAALSSRFVDLERVRERPGG